MTADEQIEKWVNGESICPNDNGECCPDFSCCNPKLKRSKEEREAFAAASQEERENMLWGYLGSLVLTFDMPIHLAGSKNE